MSPRDKGRKTSGAYIERTTSGKGRICFRWPLGSRGKLYRIAMDLDATKDRAKLEQIRDLIGVEIRAGIFVPSQRFPSIFSPKFQVPEPTVHRSLATEVKRWIDATEKRRVRVSRIRSYRSHLKNYLSTCALAERDPSGLTFEDFRELQAWLRSEAGEAGTGISEKTAANVMRGTLKAFLRDTDRTGSLAELVRLQWEETAPTRQQQPFETEDRDRLLAWFQKRRPFDEYVSLRLRFVGVTPSEARGFNVGDFDRRHGALAVRRSRDLGEVGATKTKARRRPVFLGDELAADVATLCGIRKPDEPLLRVAEDTLRDNFTKAQAALGIAHRSLYQAKHTFAVLALVEGWSPAIVARNLGISLATLERNYAAALQQGHVLGNPPRGVSGEIRGDLEKTKGRRGRASR